MEAKNGIRTATTAPRRSRAISQALRRERRSSVSRTELSRQTKRAARRRGSADLRAAARKAVETKGPAGRRAAARRGGKTRQAARAERSEPTVTEAMPTVEGRERLMQTSGLFGKKEDFHAK